MTGRVPLRGLAHLVRGLAHLVRGLAHLVFEDRPG
jgi:hypothetical protein